MSGFQREERVEICDAATKTVSRPNGQDANTFRMQLESLADAILHGTPMVNASLEDGIRAIKVMIAIGHGARHGGDWVTVEEVMGDLEHSVLRRSEPGHIEAHRLGQSKMLHRAGFGLRLRVCQKYPIT